MQGAAVNTIDQHYKKTVDAETNLPCRRITDVMLTERFNKSGIRPGYPPELRIGGKGSSLGSIPLDTLHQALHLPKVIDSGGHNIGSCNNHAASDHAAGVRRARVDKGDDIRAPQHLQGYGIQSGHDHTMAPAPSTMVGPEGSPLSKPASSLACIGLNIGHLNTGGLNIGSLKTYLTDRALPAWVGSAVLG